MDYRIFHVRTWSFLFVCMHTGGWAHRQQVDTFLTQKNSQFFLLCSWCRRGSNLRSLDLEPDALPTEPPHHLRYLNNYVVCSKLCNSWAGALHNVVNCVHVSVRMNVCDPHECSCCASSWRFQPWWPWKLCLFIIINRHTHRVTVLHTCTVMQHYYMCWWGKKMISILFLTISVYYIYALSPMRACIITVDMNLQTHNDSTTHVHTHRVIVLHKHIIHY